MSLENDETSILHEITPINSNQLAQKSIQNSAVTTVDSLVNVCVTTIIEQQAAMSSNINKLTSAFCEKLENFAHQY